MSKKRRVLTKDEKKARNRKIRNWIMLGVGIAFYAVISFAGPEILQFWFDPNAIETLILLGALIGMGILIYIIMCMFLNLINKEKDSLEDSDTMQIYNDENIDKKERCNRYCDVCSISRALNREGMNIALKDEDKEKYRLERIEDIKKAIVGAKEIVIISEQNNDLLNLEQETNELLINAIKNEEGLVVKYLFLEKDNKEIEVEQFRKQMLEATKGGKGSFEIKEIGDKRSMMGNAILSSTKIILISKKEDTRRYYTIGYMKLYSTSGEEELYYNMPFCALNTYARFAIEYMNREVKVLKHRSYEDFKEFEIKPIVALSYYKELCAINNEVKEENIDVSVFSSPSNEEILESIDKDIVYGVFHHNKLIGFSILIEDRNSERDLSNYYPKYKKEDVISFDNVEIRKEYRGYGLEKELINLSLEEAKKRKKKHVLAVVSKDNVASFSSFKKCGFKVLREDIPIYGTTRELIEYKI